MLAQGQPDGAANSSDYGVGADNSFSMPVTSGNTVVTMVFALSGIQVEINVVELCGDGSKNILFPVKPWLNADLIRTFNVVGTP